MENKVTYLFLIIFFFVFGTGFFAFVGPSLQNIFSHIPSPYFLLSAVFAEKVTPEGLQIQYEEKKDPIRVLIVPGHDKEYSGAGFKAISEANINLLLSGFLYDFFVKDSHFEVFLARDRDTGDYSPFLKNYFDHNEEEIKEFISSRKKEMNTLLLEGTAERNVTIEHLTAPSVVATRLYGINKWGNENGIDLYLHIHFNDHPGRKSTEEGKYTGFSIYIPEEQYGNARASKDIALALQKTLETIIPRSDFPLEKENILEAQELIALGSNGSQDGASVLLEYSYIYEPALQKEESRNSVLKEFAYQTYKGVKTYFENILMEKYSILPRVFLSNTSRGDRGEEVLSLQFALRELGLYPPPGKNLRDCPFTAFFGACVEKSVLLLQEKEKNGGNLLSFEQGVVGTTTRFFLNKEFSPQ